MNNLDVQLLPQAGVHDLHLPWHRGPVLELVAPQEAGHLGEGPDGGGEPHPLEGAGQLHQPLQA